MRVTRSSRGWAALVVSMLTIAIAGQALAQEKFGPKVGKPMKAAQEAIQKKQWDQAMVKIQEADSVPSKTPYEQYQINEFKGYVLLQQKKYAEVAKIYERNLYSGKLPADKVNERLKILIQLNSSIRSYPKVIEFGNRWTKAGNHDPATEIVISQAYSFQKDYKHAVQIARGAIKGAQQAGKPVDENWWNILRNAQQSMGDTAGATETMQQMVRQYPKPEYWDYLLRSRLEEKSSDPVRLNTLRLSQEVGVIKRGKDFLDMAEILLDEGLPGEAKSIMEAGYKAKVFDTTDKALADRYARRLADAKSKAAQIQRSLPALEKAAQKTPGQGDVNLGLAYWSLRQYDKAAESLSRGLKAGGVRDTDEARIILGMSNLKLKKKSDAVKAFDGVKSADPQMNDIARLWSIVAKSSAG